MLTPSFALTICVECHQISRRSLLNGFQMHTNNLHMSVKSSSCSQLCVHLGLFRSPTAQPNTCLLRSKSFIVVVAQIQWDLLPNKHVYHFGLSCSYSHQNAHQNVLHESLFKTLHIWGSRTWTFGSTASCLIWPGLKPALWMHFISAFLHLFIPMALCCIVTSANKGLLFL